MLDEDVDEIAALRAHLKTHLLHIVTQWRHEEGVAFIAAPKKA
ncbi:hypothetical protein [Streptomyces sp. NPDC088254]